MRLIYYHLSTVQVLVNVHKGLLVSDFVLSVVQWLVYNSGLWAGAVCRLVHYSGCMAWRPTLRCNDLTYWWHTDTLTYFSVCPHQVTGNELIILMYCKCIVNVPIAQQGCLLLIRHIHKWIKGKDRTRSLELPILVVLCKWYESVLCSAQKNFDIAKVRFVLFNFA